LYFFNNLKLNFKKNNILDIEYLSFLLIVLYLFPYSFTGGIQIYICYFIIMFNLNHVYKVLIK